MQARETDQLARERQRLKEEGRQGLSEAARLREEAWAQEREGQQLREEVHLLSGKIRALEAATETGRAEMMREAAGGWVGGWVGGYTWWMGG